MTCLSAYMHVPTNFQMYRQNSEKHYSIQLPPPPPSGYANGVYHWNIIVGGAKFVVHSNIKVGYNNKWNPPLFDCPSEDRRERPAHRSVDGPAWRPAGSTRPRGRRQEEKQGNHWKLWRPSLLDRGWGVETGAYAGVGCNRVRGLSIPTPLAPWKKELDVAVSGLVAITRRLPRTL